MSSISRLVLVCSCSFALSFSNAQPLQSPQFADTTVSTQSSLASLTGLPSLAIQPNSSAGPLPSPPRGSTGPGLDVGIASLQPQAFIGAQTPRSESSSLTGLHISAAGTNQNQVDTSSTSDSLSTRANPLSALSGTLSSLGRTNSHPAPTNSSQTGPVPSPLVNQQVGTTRSNTNPQISTVNESMATSVPIPIPTPASSPVSTTNPASASASAPTPATQSQSETPTPVPGSVRIASDESTQEAGPTDTDMKASSVAPTSGMSTEDAWNVLFTNFTNSMPSNVSQKAWSEMLSGLETFMTPFTQTLQKFKNQATDSAISKTANQSSVQTSTGPGFTSRRLAQFGTPQIGSPIGSNPSQPGSQPGSRSGQQPGQQPSALTIGQQPASIGQQPQIQQIGNANGPLQQPNQQPQIVSTPKQSPSDTSASFLSGPQSPNNPRLPGAN